jgi:hypothetical protein
MVSTGRRFERAQELHALDRARIVPPKPSNKLQRMEPQAKRQGALQGYSHIA